MQCSRCLLAFKSYELVRGLCGHCRGIDAREKAREETVELMKDYNMTTCGVKIIDDLFRERQDLPKVP